MKDLLSAHQDAIDALTEELALRQTDIAMTHYAALEAATTKAKADMRDALLAFHLNSKAALDDLRAALSGHIDKFLGPPDPPSTRTRPPSTETGETSTEAPR